MKAFITSLVFVTGLFSPFTGIVYSQTYFFSLDIGSENEYSAGGLIDPGDIYIAPYADGDSAFKNDEEWFLFDPPPPPVVPIGSGDTSQYTNYFDLDGEDQLDQLISLEGEPRLIETNASQVSCLWKNPHILYLSYEDDGAPGWPANDVPNLVPPTHGSLASYDEILTGTTWRTWGMTGASDELTLGLAFNPVPPDEGYDDDVDALDVETCTYWYWTCDHEACGDGQGAVLDPGTIYVTQLGMGGYMSAIPQYFLGLTNNPITTIEEDADVDAFEFCTTDDTGILQYFNGTVPGREYLAVLFSVDQDDPLTLNVDESGGLNSNTVYISLLTAEEPVIVMEYDEDIDAMAVYETQEQQDEYDFGDAPDPNYPTLRLNNGAQHRIVSTVYMGAQIDAEADGQPNASATQDDNTNLDDEDGVTFNSPLYVGQMASVDVVASVNGSLSAWIDFNQDGSWAGSTDNCFSGQALTSGINHLFFAVPVGATPGTTFARFRFTTNQVSLSYTGLVDNGEVEDYQVEIESEEGDGDICPKWMQPPDCENGLDTLSAYWDAPTMFPIVADDWYCDGRPIAGIKWWGSYIGLASNTPGPVTPPDMIRPAGFRLTWYTDIPKGAVTNYSMPGTSLASPYYNLGTFGVSNLGPGMISETYFCSSELTYLGTNVYEHEFEYTAQFPEDQVWNEKEGNIYWLSVVAVYTNEVEPPENLWGWKNTEPYYGYNDAAAWLFPGGTMWTNLTFPPPGWGYITNHPYDGMPMNMSFALISDVCPARCKKWEQPPNMELGEDMLSMTSMWENLNVVRADDFYSDGRPITDIHWWGSYIGWMADQPGTETNPVLPPAGLDRVQGFNLSWHMESELPECMPTTLLKRIYVDITNCHEVYYGSVYQYWKGDYYEHEYQYYVDLMDPDILDSGAWMETNGVHYWLDIQAVFDPSWNMGTAPHQGWGWKITHEVTACNSMVNSNDMRGWQDAIMPVGHPMELQPFDLAFELTTTNIPRQSNDFIYVGFTNQFNVNPAWHYMITTGHCGCGRQVLQQSSDLMNSSGWKNIATNAWPRPVNMWRATPLSTQRFYRVRQVQ